jgi:RNA:NAD 2'-phosphotransferase (TPT1/KptA family)
VKLYHGTAMDQVPAILRDGLIPRPARDIPPSSLLATPPCIWLTANLDYAAKVAALRGGPDGVVLQVRVKGLDLVDAGGGNFASLGRIKPKRITVVDGMTGAWTGAGVASA